MRKNKVTAEQVREYSQKNDIPMTEAKDLLVNEQAPVLQYRQQYDATIRAGMWDPIETAKSAQIVWSDWRDVPIVEVSHEDN